MEDLEVPAVDEQQPTIITVCDEVDLASAPALWSHIDAALRDSSGDLVLDLSRTTFMDATGLGVLVRAARSLAHRDAVLILRSPTPPVMALLHVAHLHKAFRIER